MSSPSDLEIQKPEDPELWHPECTKSPTGAQHFESYTNSIGRGVWLLI